MDEAQKREVEAQGGTVLGDGSIDPLIARAAVQMTRMPMVVSDPAQEDCPVIYCNEAFCELTGYGRAEIIGRNCRFLQGPDTDPATVRRIAAGLAEQRHVEEELYNYRKDGRGLWIALQISPIFDENGTLRYFFGSQIDITQRREAERRRARHIESIGALCSGVAHEFNNLMMIAVGSITQARKQAVDPRQAERLERAAWAAQRAGDQAAQLLDLAHHQAALGDLLDLNKELRDLAGTLEQVVGPDVQVVLDLTAAPVVARVDRGQLERVLLSLVRNAAEAMPQGGEARIATAVTGGPGPLATVQVVVSDTGAGMPPEIAARATEAFFTTKDVRKATGLGLFLALGFAEQAGGRLSIDTTPGEGTTVTLTVPGGSGADQ
jgi:PAS domain S-box-containing protein